MGDILDALRDNWEAVAQAPWAFALWTMIVSGAIWAAVNHLKANQLENLKSRLALRDDEIADYRRKLEGASPDEAKARMDMLEHEIARLKPRELSNEDIAAITLAASTSPGAVAIVYDMAYSAGQRMAGQMQRAFAAAGWRVSNGMVGGPTHLPPEGISIALRPEAERTTAERALINAFRSAGLAFAVSACQPHSHREGQIEVVLTQPEF